MCVWIYIIIFTFVRIREISFFNCLFLNSAICNPLHCKVLSKVAYIVVNSNKSTSNEPFQC